MNPAELDEDWELLEAGTGDHDAERSTGKRATDLWQWLVILPGEDEAAIEAAIGDLDVTYALAGGPWKQTTFTGSREDLETVRARIAGEGE